MPRMRHMHTNLMGAPRFQPTFNLCQRFQGSIFFNDPHTCYGMPPPFEKHGLRWRSVLCRARWVDTFMMLPCSKLTPERRARGDHLHQARQSKLRGNSVRRYALQIVRPIHDARDHFLRQPIGRWYLCQSGAQCLDAFHRQFPTGCRRNEQKRIDQSAIGRPRRRMDNHACGFVHDNDIIIFIDNLNWDILCDSLNLGGLGNGYFNLVPRNFGFHI
jgi:hypothetical protein